MKNFIKKNAMALVAFAIAGSSYTLMSFGSAGKPLAELHWFAKDENGDYQDMGVSETPPTSCNGFAGNVCAKGFSPENPIPSAEEITDLTPSQEERYRP